MNSLFNTWLSAIPRLEILELVIAVSMKGTVICIFAGLSTLLMRRTSASVRNIVWVFVLFGLILLPAFSFIAPVWRIPILPELDRWGQHASVHGNVSVDAGGKMEEGLLRDSSGGKGDSDGSHSPQYTGSHWSSWVLLIWIGGAALYLCWALVSHAGLWLIVRKAVPAGNSWNDVLRRVAAGMGLRRRIRLLKTDDIKAALTVGIFRPVVIVPAGSLKWPEERRSLILSHELAHVRRWDGLIELLALVATSFYWFNPLVWLAVKQLRVERERDCDDAVLGTGAKPSDYAALLMDIAVDLGGATEPLLKLATISQGSNLKERLMCILNPKISRKRISCKSVLIVGIMIAALVVPLSLSGLWETKAQEKSQQEEKALKEKKLLQKKEAEKKKISVEEKVFGSWKKIEEQEFSAARMVGRAIKKSGIDKGVKLYFKLRSQEDSEYYFKESEFNTLGYVLLVSEKVEEAVKVFELNVKAYPESWNVYDSLGEAYMVKGDLELAAKNYEKSLKLNPDNENGIKMLQKLKEKAKHRI